MQTSTLLTADQSSPYSVSVTPSHLSALADGTIVFIRAVAQTNSHYNINQQYYKDLGSAQYQAVIRANYPPTDITLTPSYVDENKVADTKIGELTTTDLDVGQGHTYSIISDPYGAFSLSGSTILSAISYDYETRSSYPVTIQTCDLYDCFTKAFTITINDVNDPPSTVTPTSVTLAENYALNTQITQFVATDQDTGAYSKPLTYSITNGHNKFAVSTSGVLTLFAALDYESTKSYSIVILVSDTYSFTQTVVTVNVTDVNEAPTAITLSCTSTGCQVEEQSDIGTLVANLTAVDQDAGDSATFR